MTPRLLLLLLLAVASTAVADPRNSGRNARNAEAREHAAAAHQARRASLAESVRRVERILGGQILSAERVPFDGRNLNRIKVVDATGRVRVITEDPYRRPTRRDVDDALDDFDDDDD